MVWAQQARAMCSVPGCDAVAGLWSPSIDELNRIARGGRYLPDTPPIIADSLWAMWPPDRPPPQQCGHKCGRNSGSWPCRLPCSFRKNHDGLCCCAYHRYLLGDEEEEEEEGALDHRLGVRAGRSRSMREAAAGKRSRVQQQQILLSFA